MTVTAVNPYLDNNFAPVSEEITADDLVVLGELPADLCGMFVRNGPNPQFPPSDRYHWFEGDGMLHGVHLANGKASYRNRYVQTQKFKSERDANRAIAGGLFGSSPKDRPRVSGNTANTAFVYHAGRLLALWEGGEPHAIELPSLDTLGSYNYGGKLASSFTAHPKVDPITGEMMFFGYSLVAPPYLHYGVVSPEGELLRTVPIELPMGVMMHDFAITENYSIFMDLPLTFSMQRAQRGEPLLMFESNRPSRFGIVPRHGDNSNIRWFETTACYVFHTLNAYEDGDEIVLIASRMHGTTVLGASNNNHDGKSDIPRLHRWRFNIKTGAIKEEYLDDVASEFPRINEQFLGRNSRYGYTARSVPTSMPLFDGLIKYDLLNDASQTHKFGRDRYGGEGVFVPRPNATTEDDGWLLTFVRDTIKETSELVVVSAKDMTAEPVARVIIPQRVPYGFHGTWVADSQIAG